MRKHGCSYTSLCYKETQRNTGWTKYRDSRNQRNTPKRKASLTTQTSIMPHATTTPAQRAHQPPPPCYTSSVCHQIGSTSAATIPSAECWKRKVARWFLQGSYCYRLTKVCGQETRFSSLTLCRPSRRKHFVVPQPSSTQAQAGHAQSVRCSSLPAAQFRPQSSSVSSPAEEYQQSTS
jgi:hypothetical protein